jgi:hypothetical protein
MLRLQLLLPLSDVPLHVIIEMALRDESRGATRLLAYIGPQACVRANVRFEISLLIKAFSALSVRAGERARISLYIIY